MTEHENAGTPTPPPPPTMASPGVSASPAGALSPTPVATEVASKQENGFVPRRYWETREYRDSLPARRVDYVRAIVTISLIVIFAVVILGGGCAAIKPLGKDQVSTWSQVKDYLNVALPAITGLLGSAIGFYFGALSSPARESANASSKDETRRGA